tara:strand:+ start:198 stop:566 length:369 start_codon:yes stop_codon:yes gene_type:complete
MSNFPALEPESRTYTEGTYAVLKAKSLLGGEFSVRKNNAAIDYKLSLVFTSGSIVQSDAIFEHYALHNRFQPFDLPATVLAGATFQIPANYQWIYASSPASNFSAKGAQVTVELILVAPYEI